MASLTDSKNFKNDFMAAPNGRLPYPGLNSTDNIGFIIFSQYAAPAVPGA
jgi:hypothetical protein